MQKREEEKGRERIRAEREEKDKRGKRRIRSVVFAHML